MSIRISNALIAKRLYLSDGSKILINTVTYSRNGDIIELYYLSCDFFMMKMKIMLKSKIEPYDSCNFI